MSTAPNYELGRRIYENDGNLGVVELVDRAAVRVLDVGCGSGGNAAVLLARDPHKQIFGITASPEEAKLARQHMAACVVTDLEAEIPSELGARAYDALVFSHVLEHLRDPARVLERWVRLLRPGGHCVIAVPNVLHWRQRWDFVRGRFEYSSGGTMDATHLRFYTYETAARYLLARTPELELVQRSARGSVPLGPLRHRMLTAALRRRLDGWGSERWPNLFGAEILLKARKAEAAEKP